jgi:hypothetical protein
MYEDTVMNFFEDYRRKEYRKMNVVSENKKYNFGIVVKVLG